MNLSICRIQFMSYFYTMVSKTECFPSLCFAYNKNPITWSMNKNWKSILRTYTRQPSLLSATCLGPGGCVKINISSVFRNAAFQSPTAAVSASGITQSKDVRMKETWRFQAIDSRSRRVPLVWRHAPVSSSLTLFKKLSLHLCIGANSWTSSETSLSNLHYESM